MKKLIGEKKYDITDKMLGKGAFGVVYLAVERKTKKEYAVKILKKVTIENSSKNMEYFAAEKKVMTEICHPNLLHCYDIEEDSNHYYLYLKYCRSGTLTDLIKASGPLSEMKATFFLLQLLHGFRELHQRKIMHRDLKPDNILLDNNLVVIGDFGLVKEGTVAMTNVGTPVSQAPEILLKRFSPGQGSYYVNRVDIWSLGVCYYYMLFGKFPWSISRIDELVKDVQTKSGYNLEFPVDRPVSSDTKNLLIRMIEKEPSKRISWDMIFVSQIFLEFIERAHKKDPDCSQLVASIDRRIWKDMAKPFLPYLHSDQSKSETAAQSSFPGEKPTGDSQDSYKPIRACIDDHYMLSESLLEFAKDARALVKNPDVMSSKKFRNYIVVSAVALASMAVVLLRSFQLKLDRKENFTTCDRSTWEKFLQSSYCRSIYTSICSHLQVFEYIVAFYVDKALGETSDLENEYDQLLTEIKNKRDASGVIALDRLDSVIKRMGILYPEKAMQRTDVGKELRRFIYCCSSGLEKYRSVEVMSQAKVETDWIVWRKQLNADTRATQLLNSLSTVPVNR